MKLLMIVLIVIVVLALLWLWRNKADHLGRGFIESVRKMEKECSTEGRYQVPWLLLLGDDQKHSESLCRAWQLKTTEKAAWFGRFFYSSDAVVLLPPHDMYQQAEGALAVLSTWRRLLASLLRVRGQRPVDAVIWAVSAERLLRKDAVPDVAQCRQFQDAQQKLGQTLPVYWLITGLQDLSGVNELIEALPDQAQEGVLGWSSVLPLSAAYQREHLDSAISQTQRQLSDCITEIATLNGGVSDNLYLLPRQLDRLRPLLQALGEAAFQTNAMGDAPVLRGVYFVAGYAHPQSEGDVFAPQPEPVPDAPVFAARLLRQRIAAERGLAQPIVRILALRQRWYRLARLIAMIFCSLWLLAMIWVWQQARQDAIVLNRVLSALGSESSQIGGDPSGQSAVALWRALFAVPRLDFENVVFPVSLLSGFDQSLAEKVAGLLQTEWFLPVYRQLQADLKTLQLEGESIEKKSRDEALSPETWPRYLSAQRLVQQAKALEQNMASYHRALRGGADALAQLSELSNRVWDSDFRPERLPLRNRLEVILSQYALWMGRPLKLETATQTMQQHFSELMQGWLNRLFADATFIETADSVQQQLNALQGEERNSYAELKRLNEQIGLLRQLITATNAAWSSASGQDLVPGYSAMLTQARVSHFIGKEVVQKIEAHAAMLRKAFKERWSNRESSLTASGDVGLKEDVLQLQTAIAYLLQQDFVVKAQATGTLAVAGSLKEMNEARLAEALLIYQDRQRYQTQALVKVPDAYRQGLSGFASKSTANAMWFMMGGHAIDDLGQRNAVDSVDGLIRAAPEIKVALLDLNRVDLAAEFVREMNERALAVLRRADSQLEDMAPYQPRQATFSWWDGKKNASFKAFKVNNSLELQQYLKRQQEQINTLSAKQDSVLDWLNAHQKSLSSKDLQLFARWRGVAAELKKFKEKAPDSGPAFLTQMISKDLNEMDISNCHSILQQLELPAGSGLFAERTQRLVQMANDRCSGLRSQNSAYAWQQLSSYFNVYIAGRFPFAANASAPDAEIERVTTLLRLIDTHLPAVEAGLDESDSVHKEAAKFYLQGLQYTRELLGPILLRGTAEQPQPVGLDLDVQWRSDKDKEQGADQVIEWGLTVGTQRQRYPQGERGKLRWLAGQPLSFSLRWAADSVQRPLEEISQPSLMVFEQNAEWRYTGTWSLLRFLRHHRAPLGMVLQDEYSYPALLFSLPVGGALKDTPRAQMFARFGISAVGAKSLLPIQLINALPLKAPASPFRQITLPDSDKGAP